MPVIKLVRILQPGYGARRPDRPSISARARTLTSHQTISAAATGSRQGIAWMMLAMFFFVSMDTCVKYLVETYAVIQIVWARYFFHLLILIVLLAPKLRTTLKTNNLKLQLLRSVLLLITTGLFFFALRHVPLADASAVMLIAPIIVTALSVPLLKEHVGVRRWAGVVIGFAGAILIIKPGMNAAQLAIFLPAAAAICYAVYQISTRFLSHSDPVLTTLLYTASIGALLTSIAAPFVWTAPSFADWSLMALLGVLGGIGHFALIKAFTAAPAATVAPFNYTNMIWAIGYGYLVFGDFPDIWTIVGATVIAASGLYILRREQSLGR